MIIEAFQGLCRCTNLCVDAAKFSITILEEVAARKDKLSEPAINSLPPSNNGVPFKMWEAARRVGAPDLTPMATVAGAVADATADFLHAFEMSKTIVNNGGDIAIRLAGGEFVSVGIRSDINRPEITHRISISEDLGIGGVCTSGLGGRSFTRGITSATTTLAKSAILADAAATAIANATFIDHPNIVRRLAEKLDPQTDLKGVDVTCSVGDLEEEFVEACLNKALAYAETLADQGTIVGAVVSIKGQTRITKGIKSIISVIS